MVYYNYQVSHPHCSSSSTDYYTTTTSTTITTYHYYYQSLNRPLFSSLYMTYIPAASRYKEISIVSQNQM